MSATHSWLMSVATNWRLTKSGAGRARLLRSVVMHQARLRLTPASLAARIRWAMRFLLATTP